MSDEKNRAVEVMRAVIGDGNTADSPWIQHMKEAGVIRGKDEITAPDFSRPPHPHRSPAMTEQFQVGRVYATRGGDRVRVSEVWEPILYGVFMSGEREGQAAVWWASGSFSEIRNSEQTPNDLLPGPLPDPVQDDKAELLAILELIASQCPPCAHHTVEDGQSLSDDYFQSPEYYQYLTARALSEVGDIARRAIAKAERT